MRKAERARGRSGDRRVTLSEAKEAGQRSGPFALLGVTLLATVVTCLTLAVRPLAAQLHGQHWDVTPETARPTVGDTITIAFRVRLDERDLLFDTVPKPALTPPDWIRVFSVEKLQRQPDRIYVGRARIAFYRPGRQAVPLFQLPFMRSVKGLSRGTLLSDSASVEVVPVLAAGSSATLRDIKEPAPSRARPPLELLLSLGALGAAGWLAWRARRHMPTDAVELAPSPPAPPPPDPYDIASRRLDEIAEASWRHYAEIADTLRDYLEAHGIPARERTTRELHWSLPPGLIAGPAERRFTSVFGQADLVKFAHWRPAPDQADAFLEEARALLAAWRDATPAREAADAVG